jgi:hypothetical protein
MNLPDEPCRQFVPPSNFQQSMDEKMATNLKAFIAELEVFF